MKNSVDDMSLEEFAAHMSNIARSCYAHQLGQTIAVRNADGSLRSLTADESKQLGFGVNKPDLSFLHGRTFPIRGTRFLIKFA